ncbi:hypothetical protein Q8W71_13080 [Methylobacterium sp. NEAU 140]|uniref:hypothetical protein n=1 Tax=Methylobacterium sp. NEAU 140 TaxID=3064945 RepID=UPI002732B5E3|nr:hypothetical protein [Methylobacterium sp. NEAU 140]MDP4023565.1 hypothetical protein [Methylobacterium sp. NEAU 140]
MKPLIFTTLTLLGAPALASAQDIPVQQDLKRMERVERRLDRDGLRRPVDPNVTPDNPDGVVGFDGPPFNYGDPGVMGDAPLPPGSPADIDDE